MFKPACGTNHIVEDAAVWILPHYISGMIEIAINSRTFSEDKPELNWKQ